MSYAVRQFLARLDENEPNDSITEAWEQLSEDEQSEADEFARAGDTIEMDIPVLWRHEVGALLAAGRN